MRTEQTTNWHCQRGAQPGSTVKSCTTKDCQKKHNYTLGNSVIRTGKKGWTLLYGGNIKIGKNEVRVHTYVELCVVGGGGGLRIPQLAIRATILQIGLGQGFSYINRSFQAGPPHWLSLHKNDPNDGSLISTAWASAGPSLAL
jgi:hypothetical protein